MSRRRYNPESDPQWKGISYRARGETTVRALRESAALDADNSWREEYEYWRHGGEWPRSPDFLDFSKENDVG